MVRKDHQDIQLGDKKQDAELCKRKKICIGLLYVHFRSFRRINKKIVPLVTCKPRNYAGGRTRCGKERCLIVLYF